MAEDAFERFRRLRNVAPVGSVHLQAQKPEAPLSPLTLFQQLSKVAVALTTYPDGTLRYRAPEGVLTPDLIDVIRQHKHGLHTLVEAFEERAAIAEYCGGLPRTEAERLAWECVPPGQTSTAGEVAA